MTDALLVTGGAGFIGSHMVKLLARQGHPVVVFDSLSTGHRDAVRGAELVVGDLRDPADVAAAFRGRRIGAVLHFAASCYVGESVHRPDKYYDNNVVGTINLLRGMHAAGVQRLVFSSSCSTYGHPQADTIGEDHPQAPVNPYGATKLACERAMRDFGEAGLLRTVALRYFNAAGCDAEGELGERHDPETHLIPLVLREAARELAGGPADATALQVFGDDFDTPDGTCIRDYVHVADLCEAHRLALGRLRDGTAPFEAFNLGTGRGHSVLEVIDTCRRVTGAAIHYRTAGRRKGDPARLVASGRRARDVLGWQPAYPDLEPIVDSAWRWFAGQSRAERTALA